VQKIFCFCGSLLDALCDIVLNYYYVVGFGIVTCTLDVIHVSFKMVCVIWLMYVWIETIVSIDMIAHNNYLSKDEKIILQPIFERFFLLTSQNHFLKTKCVTTMNTT
jgi:hypothetical protein